MKEGWKTVKLGEIAKFINGDRGTNYPSKKDYVTDGVPFVNAGNLSKDGLNIRTLNYISIPKYDSLSQGKFGGGDILFCLRGTLGKHSIVQNGLYGAIASSLVIIRASDCCINKYISYFLDYKQLFIEKLNNGAAQPNIPAKTMKEFTIPLPPLSEQVEIVTYLDTSFAKIDAIKANAEKELEEAKKLFAAALNEAMTPKEGWVEKTLGEIGNLKNGMNFSKNEKGYTLRLLGVADFGNKFCINDVFTLPVLSLNQMPNEEYLLCDGDIVFVRSNGNKKLVGRSILLENLVEPTTYSGFCIRLRKTDNSIDTKYLVHYLKTSKTRQQMFGNGANISNLNQGILSNVNIYYPPLTEQHSIVTHLDTLSEKVRQLQSNYEKISSECDALKQAILRDTFE